MVFKIAKAELRNLFYSPVAWVLMAAFLIQCAYFYTNVLYTYANWQDVLIKNNPKWAGWDETFTRVLFLGEDGLFKNVLQNLYLFIPLLTMGVISREVQNGTIKLLYSSPIMLREMVWGKYLALMIYNALLVLILGIFLVSGMMNIHHVDYGVLLSAALGFFLLTCAYTSIGVFMSSLSTYQIVSAIGSFILLFALNRIGELWQRIDFVRDLTWFLNISGRADKMLVGLITTKDVIYFIVVAYIFISFTLIKLKAEREAKSWPVKIIRYAFVLATGLLVGYFSSRPMLTGYWDTTENDINTISKNTQEILKNMGDAPLEVTLYTNLLGKGSYNGFPEVRNSYLTNVWEKYQRFKPNISFNYVYYYDYDSTIQGTDLIRNFPGQSLDKIAQTTANLFDYNINLFMKPEEIKERIDLRPEGLRLVMQLKYKNQTTFLRTYDDTHLWPTENHMAATLKQIQLPQPLKIAILSGNLERSPYKKGEREFRRHTCGKESRDALINLGFDIDTLSLETRDIPANLSTLVIADPKVALSTTTFNKIKQYTEKGGNLYILGEPGKQYILNPLLQPMGLKLLDGILVQPSYHEMPDMVEPYLTGAAFSLFRNPSRRDFQNIPGDYHLLMPNTTAISWSDSSGFKSTSIFDAIEGATWLKTTKLVTDSAAITYQPREGDRKGLFSTTVASTRMINNKQQRIILSGDADYISNIHDQTQRFALGFHCWLTYGEFPVKIPEIHFEDKRLTITGKSAFTLTIIYLYVLPGLLLSGGILLLIRRRRK